jgi:hypothetical protein
MIVYVFKSNGRGSRFVYESIRSLVASEIHECSVWSYSTYYGTKSPGYKLTVKESLSIICPHVFVGDSPILVSLKKETQASAELKKIEGFRGMICGRVAKPEMSALVEIIRAKRRKLGSTNVDMLMLSIYDCISDAEKSLEQCRNEITLCDRFIKQHVMYPNTLQLNHSKMRQERANQSV